MNVAFLVIPLLIAPLLMTAGMVVSDDYVHINFLVIDVDTGVPVTSCKPIKMDISTSSDGPFSPVGIYGHMGSYSGGIYRMHRFTPLSCLGYEFDHWSVEGTYYSKRTSGNLLFVYMKTEPIAWVIMYLKKTGYKLEVSVDPLSSGEVSPYGVGTHTVPSGSRVSLTPRPNAGWKFDHWTLDGSPVNFRILRFTMNENHKVTAHFVKEKRKVMPPPIASPAPEACKTFPSGWPYSSKYRGYTEDMEFNSDLLSGLSGKAKYWERDNVITVGWMAVKPQPWDEYGVEIREGFMAVNGSKFFSGEGRDYGLVYVECKGDHSTRVAGVTKRGTRAALMWLLENQSYMRGKIVVVVEWQDSNLNGRVEGKEIRVLYEVP